jgi:spore coat polysaccharide biosynthesis protein SpsF (cytidylyltransferase family)
MINRVKKSNLLEKIIVATTIDPSDDPIEKLCNDNNIFCTRGSISDVAERYIEAALIHDIDLIVRLTADCPFIDPHVIDQCINEFTNSQSLYVANTVPPNSRTYPDGSDVEIFYVKTLNALSFHSSLTASDREHVTHGFWKNKITSNLFSPTQVVSKRDMSAYRYTVDYPVDYDLAVQLATMINDLRIDGTTFEICDILDANPELVKLNAGHTFGEGWSK